MAANSVILFASLVALLIYHHHRAALASDPSPLRDYCVANADDRRASRNGFLCKDESRVTVADFTTSGLHVPGNTSNKLGSKITLVNVDRIPGINSLGVSMSRIDFAPYGLNPPHTHPRSSETLHVEDGVLYAGFVTANSDDGNRLFSKKLRKGDAIAFPQGLAHFQFNCASEPAVAYASFGSQHPGLNTIGNALFGSRLAIKEEVLAEAFQLDEKTVQWLQKQTWVDNSR